MKKKIKEPAISQDYPVSIHLVEEHDPPKKSNIVFLADEKKKQLREVLIEKLRKDGFLTPARP